MLCSKCKHKHYDHCEDCMECDLFEDDFPEEYQRKDECGCVFNERTIESRIKVKEEKYHQFVKELIIDFQKERARNESTKTNRENTRLLG